MLYQRWLEIAHANADEPALVDVASGRRWTFRALAEEAERENPSESRVAFPQGNSPEFILMLLRAWRQKRPACPLDSGQSEPAITSALPKGIVHLKTTSASTGASKLVAFQASQLAADPRNIVATMGLRPEWPNIGIISLAHSYGFSNLVLPLLLHGIPLVLAGSNLPEGLRRAAQTFPEMTLASVPALWRAWHDAGAIPTNVRLAISAGAPLPLGLEEAVHARWGVKIHNFYGSSECGGIAYDASHTPRTTANCVGTPMRNAEVGLGEDGCVEVRGEAVAETYWPEPNPNLQNGIFRSADLGEFHEGLLFLRGRRGDQINVAGRKVAPELIEHVLESCPGVRECLVFGAPEAEAQRGETIVACVELGHALSRDKLRQFAIGRLPAWQVPREWWIVESLSANERGKRSRAEWRERYLRERVQG